MNDIMMEVKKLVAEALDMDDPEKIGDDAEFFSIGGNSLTAMMVIEGIQNKYLIDFNFSSLYEKVTIRDMANYIETKISARESR